MDSKVVNIENIQVSNIKPFVLFGGLNVLETRDLGLIVAEHFKNTCEDFLAKAEMRSVV